MSRPDPEDDPPLRPLIGRSFWLLVALSAACIVAGAAVAVLGPRLL